MYIGQTCNKNIKKRFGKNGIQYRKCVYFWNAIQKYGWTGFEHVTLFEDLTKEMADIIEIELIKKYDTTNPNCGYNLSKGGAGRRVSKNVYQYDIDGNLIKIWAGITYAALELNILLSNISACCLRKTLTCANYVWSYEELEKSYFEEINYPRCIRIKQYDKRGNFIKIFNAISDASDSTGISVSNISRSCRLNGEAVCNSPYRWTYEDIDINLNNIKIHRNGRRIEILQYNLDNTFLKVWNSASEAEQALGINHSHIAACCRGKQKTSGGYIWKYKY